AILDDQTEAISGGVRRIGSVRAAVAVVLIVGRLVEELLVGVVDVFPEKPVPRAAPSGVAGIVHLVGPGGGPAIGVVGLCDAELRPARVHVAADRFEGPRRASALLVVAEVGDIHDPHGLAAIRPDVGLNLGTDPELRQRDVLAVRVLGPLVPEVAGVTGLRGLRPVRDGGAYVIAVDVVTTPLERIHPLLARDVVAVDLLRQYRSA